MTQTSFPFENIDTTETQFSQMFRTLNRGVNGTPDGGELEVTAGTGLAVDVAAGQAMVRGHFYISTAVEELSLATADATNDRIDTIALELDPTANSIVLVVVEGTPAGSPVAPTLTQTDAGVYQMPLANVLVEATAGVPSTITDRREFMGSKVGVWDTDGRPAVPAPGQIGYNTTEESWEGWDPIAETWSAIGGGGGGVTVSDTEPTDPAQGDLWLDSTSALMYVYYDDGASAQWVSAVGGTIPYVKVVQLVSATYGTEETTTSSTYVDTSLTLDITPQYSTSKMLIMLSIPAEIERTGSTNSGRGEWSVRRDAVTEPVIPKGELQFDDGNTSNKYLRTLISCFGFDEPNTTSTVTYTASFKAESGDLATSFKADAFGALIVMEIAE